MRHFQLLNHVHHDEANAVLTLSAEHALSPMISLKIEGSYVAIAFVYGAFEIALRPRSQELTRVLARLRPIEGQQAPRQVGSGESYLSLGLSTDGQLLLRPTIVSDASGLFSLNFALHDTARTALYQWLSVTPEV
jgi:hypothetical protein